MFVLRPTIIRSTTLLRAKKDDFVAPSDAPGEGNRRFPTWDEKDEPETKEVNPIKKFLMEKFKIKEIDYTKFDKENKWAIHPEHKDKDT